MTAKKDTPICGRECGRGGRNRCGKPSGHADPSAGGTVGDPCRAPRGFAAMPREKFLAIAKKGGDRAADLGAGHRFTPDEGRAAGRQGGARVAEDRQHMSRIGKKGRAAQGYSGPRAGAGRGGGGGADDAQQRLPLAASGY